MKCRSSVWFVPCGRVTQIEIWARRIAGPPARRPAGGVFTGIGAYMSLKYIFHLFG